MDYFLNDLSDGTTAAHFTLALSLFFNIVELYEILVPDFGLFFMLIFIFDMIFVLFSYAATVDDLMSQKTNQPMEVWSWEIPTQHHPLHPKTLVLMMGEMKMTTAKEATTKKTSTVSHGVPKVQNIGAERQCCQAVLEINQIDTAHWQ